jgi:hypothetical protein
MITLLALMFQLAPLNLQAPDGKCSLDNLHETVDIGYGMQYCDGSRWLPADILDNGKLTIAGYPVAQFNRRAYIDDDLHYTEQVELAAARECPLNVSTQQINCQE